MGHLYPEIKPYNTGMLDVSEDNTIYYEECGNPNGKPALVLHGGPGSGCTPNHRRFFDPSVYKIILFDQRNCGRSLPHASDPEVSLESNTTPRLMEDIELLREHLEVESWLVFGASWGTTLALAYAEQYPERVSEIVLNSVVTTTAEEVEWITRGVGRYLPEDHRRFIEFLPPDKRDGNIAKAYSDILESDNVSIRDEAAVRWCDWEDRHVFIGGEHHHDTRYDDPKFRMAFARIVTHYWSNAAWLGDSQLLNNVTKLNGIPGVMIHGRKDVSSKIEIPQRFNSIITV